MPHILLVDDDRAITASLGILLRRAGFSVSVLHHAREVEETLGKARTRSNPSIDLVILDMNFAITTTGRAGLDTLRLIKRLSPKLPVVLITGWATVQLAVEGMKLGASDFVAKPWDNAALLGSIRGIFAKAAGTTSAAEIRGEGMAVNGFEAILGESPRLLEQLDLARRVAATDASVLLTGESGTGKELVAEAIHAASPRAAKPFVRVNLGGVPDALFESELFGHKAGAFTDARTDRQGRFALAEGGTIFLDEIGDLAFGSQVKLLRVLQEHTYEVLGESRPRRTDVRVVCATHRDLPAMIAAGTFREDLFYRINLIAVELPPLRRRGRDVVLLARRVLAQAARRYDRAPLSLKPGAQEWLLRRPWPGNVRQLRNLLERCALLYTGEVSAEQLEAQAGSRDTAPALGATIDELSLDDLERTAVERALVRHDGQVAGAARDLGITRSALYRRMEKFGLG